MSDASPFDRAAAILEKVERLPQEERTVTALRLAQGEPEVLALLEPMLAGLDEDSHVLDRPVLEGFTTFEQELAAFGDVEMPEQIAGYRLVRPIGEGGMGVVFEAQQSSPNRRVALKLLRGGLFDPSLLKRFEQETAVLGYLNHPGIAQVYEGGTAQVGATAQPFIAMELVQGVPIDEYARKQQLSVRARVRLLAELCDAVQHAHQKGVVHRDLKPVNVLVDAAGHVKVLDFGIARITASDFGATQGATSTGQIVGTLPYMSPEQVAGDLAAVDTRSDVYALGVIAYELFAGTRPIDVAGKSLPEAARLITEQEPKPLGVHGKEFRGDLETIVGKALRKDRELRYGSAGAMADDWRRFLHQEPILAHAPSRTYLLRKFVRRNPGLVLGIATLMILSIGFAIVTAIQNQRISTQRDLAERKNRLSWEVADFLVQLFDTARPSEARSKQLTARGLLDIGSQRIRNDVTADPELRSELLLVMARTYNALGVPNEAKPLLDEALAIRERLGLDPRGLADAKFEQAVLFSLQGNFEGAFNNLERLRADLPASESETDPLRFRVNKSLINVLMARQKRQEAMELAESHYEECLRLFGPDAFLTVKALALRGTTYEEMARFDDSLADLQKAQEGMAALRGKDSPDYISILRMLGDLYQHMEEPQKCIEVMEEALRLDRAVFGEDHPNVDEDLYLLASAVSDLGELDRALELFLEVYERDRRILGENHPYVGIDATEIADVYSNIGQYDLADEWYERGIAIQREAYPDDHLEIATTLSNFANHLHRSGQVERALELHREALAIRLAGLPADHPAVLSSHNAVAVMLGDLQRYDEAEPIFRDVLRLRREVLGRTPMVAGSMFTLAHNLNRQGRAAEALPLVEEAVEIFEEFHGPDHLDTARAWFFLGRLLLDLERYGEAQPLLEEALRVRQLRLVPGHKQIASVEFSLGHLWAGLGDWPKADGLFCESFRKLVHLPRRDVAYADGLWQRYLSFCQDRGVEPGCDLESMRAERGD